ncbi:Putative membrane protein [Burkholderia diffusa]|uniref:hypothetical protein n=1 Tax=Burkholderia diffusa TaxID=488732 RepID=UPI001CAC6840|nr:hypothetical protein [Burkholderia diffusa]CAG9243163.1 Putative membrane protein [Burkholderia diffusa]
MTLNQPIHRPRASADGRTVLQLMRHLVLCGLSIALASVLNRWAQHARNAAQRGDPAVRAARAAVRSLLHHRDAVSFLEHALSGVGMACAGVAALQFYYFVDQLVRAGDLDPRSWRWRALPHAFVAAGIGALASLHAYGRTGSAAVVVAGLVVGVLLVWPDAVRRGALTTPAWFIGIVSALVWLQFDVAWKISAWPTTHDTAGVVFAHLLASGATLVGCSAAAGLVVRRVAWLRPAGI